MPVDNELYNHLSDTWWNEQTALGILRTWYNPVRFGYFRRVLIEEQQRDPFSTSVLDVGCGGGLLAEEFATLGCRVTGIDPSEPSLQTARNHARQSGLDIVYQSGVGEHLPFADASFDVVVCCDVLEHVQEVVQIVREIARVLKPGGYFFYDTINRSTLSWLATIKLAQEWKLTRFMPPDLHDWHKFIKPAELLGDLRACHLQHQEIRGISPRSHPLVSLILFLQQKQGKITLTEMGKRMQFHESKDLSTSYMGYALK
jgi:2-polyprenyl-6-hydroxyphenyl methylase/3-demethylubiquinone-9 3-methyltransferase